MLQHFRKITEKHLDVIVLVGLGTVALILYGSTLRFDFFQDDYVWLSRARETGFNVLSRQAATMSNFFMPTIQLYFSLALKFFGTTPAHYHAANILLHIINTWFVFLIFSKTLNDKRMAVTAAFLFIAMRYPLEALVWISAITELITAFFLLSTALIWIFYLEKRQWRYYIPFLFGSVLTLSSKEWSALLIPFIVVVTILWYHRNLHKLWKEKRYLLIRLAPLIFVFSVYLVFQFFLQKEASPLVRLGYYSFGWHFIPHIVLNILTIFVPYVTFAKTHTMLWLGLSVIFLPLLVTVTWVLWHRTRSSIPWVALGWLPVAFFPTSFFTWSIFTSRYAYFAAFGAALFLAYLVHTIADRFSHRYAMVGAVVVLFIIGNFVLIQSRLKNYYYPIFVGNKNYTAAATKTLPELGNTSHVGVYAETPIKDFVLPDYWYGMFAIQKARVRVLKPGDPCPTDFICLHWTHTTQIITIEKSTP